MNTHNSIPPRRLNGGLYTGEPFASRAWANVPIVPDAGNMVHDAMAIGNPTFPRQAAYQYVCYPRPGNSTDSVPGLVHDTYTMMSFPPK